jgi:hypothetical protein
MTTIRTFAPETFYTERADTCIDETFPRTNPYLYAIINTAYAFLKLLRPYRRLNQVRFTVGRL